MGPSRKTHSAKPSSGRAAEGYTTAGHLSAHRAAPTPGTCATAAGPALAAASALATGAPAKRGRPPAAGPHGNATSRAAFGASGARPARQVPATTPPMPSRGCRQGRSPPAPPPSASARCRALAAGTKATAGWHVAHPYSDDGPGLDIEGRLLGEGGSFQLGDDPSHLPVPCVDGRGERHRPLPSL